MLVIQPDENVENLLKSYHALWSTAISFITIERTPQDIGALNRRWSQCTCNYNGDNIESRLHLLALSFISLGPPSGPDGGLGILIHSLLRLFVTSAEVLRAVSVAKGRKSGMWPVSPRDLIPYSKATPPFLILQPNILIFLNRSRAVDNIHCELGKVYRRTISPHVGIMSHGHLSRPHRSSRHVTQPPFRIHDRTRPKSLRGSPECPSCS